MTLTEYLAAKLPEIGPQMHQKTIYEYGRGVKRLADWLGYDPDLSDVTPDLIRQFEAESGVPSVKQLASNLRSLMRTHDPELFPTRHRQRYKAFDPEAVMDDAPETPTRLQDIGTLVEFSQWYLAGRSVSPMYASTIRKRCAALQRFSGKTAIAEVLTEAVVNAFLSRLTCSPYTANRYRGDFLAVWRAAADVDLVAYPVARRIRKRPQHELIIDCLDENEVARLVAAAEQKLKGCLPDGRARRHYWSAIIRAGWDTALRRGDLFQLRADMADADGYFRVVQHKTQKVVRCHLKPATIEAMRKAGGSLDWPFNLRSFTLGWHRVVELAELGRRAQFKWLRRGAGSVVESMQPGGGAKLLGNTDQIFRCHYDAKLRPVDLPRTPELKVI